MAVVFAGIGSRASAIVDINASTGGNLLVTSGKPFFSYLFNASCTKHVLAVAYPPLSFSKEMVT